MGIDSPSPPPAMPTPGQGRPPGGGPVPRRGDRDIPERYGESVRELTGIVGKKYAVKYTRETEKGYIHLRKLDREELETIAYKAIKTGQAGFDVMGEDYIATWDPVNHVMQLRIGGSNV